MTLVIVQKGHGGPEVLQPQESTTGLPGAGMVTLLQKAIGFNYFDVFQRKGLISNNSSDGVMGIEGAGIVTEVGAGVQGFAVGDRVGYLRSQGAYAHTRLIEADALYHLPDDVSFELAAALTVKGFMAWLCTRQLFVVEHGQTVLVTTAAGGVGSLTTRLAAHFGARVIGVVGSRAKRHLARASGAAEVAVGLDEAIELVELHTRKMGVDVVFDGIGQRTAERLFLAGTVRPGGTAISFGASGGWPNADHDDVARRGFVFMAPQAMHYLKSAGDLRAAMTEVFKLYRAGAFGEVSPSYYRLEDAAWLHQEVESRSTAGIAVLIP